jgi:Holliday junction resolvase RusA-like endonuclease
MCCVEQVGTPRVPGPVAVRIVFTMAIPQSRPRAWREAALAGRILPTSKPDWDNLAKLTSDALNGIAWADDAEVASAHVVKRYGPMPGTCIAWWAMGEAECASEAASAAPWRGAWGGAAAGLL